MIPEIRKSFNEKFLNENYEAFIKEMDSRHGEISFRIAETPVFVPKSFSNQMIDACESIVDIIKSPSFKTLTEKAVPENLV
ncbi:MAG TPA: hypothetical protein PLS00_13770, partial [Niabella sp.]|nr:hypothetical protein [Niabella sp.]